MKTATEKVSGHTKRNGTQVGAYERSRKPVCWIQLFVDLTGPLVTAYDADPDSEDDMYGHELSDAGQIASLIASEEREIPMPTQELAEEYDRLTEDDGSDKIGGYPNWYKMSPKLQKLLIGSELAVVRRVMRREGYTVRRASDL